MTGDDFFEEDEDVQVLLRHFEEMKCRIYFCPTSGQYECMAHGGFDECCDSPHLHIEVKSP